MVNTFAVGSAAADTGSPTQNLTISGFGIPDFVQVWLVSATAVGTPVNDEVMSKGCVEVSTSPGGPQWAIGYADEDASPTSNCETRAHSSRLIMVLNPNVGTTTVADYAIQTGAVTDGIQITWNGGTAPGSAYRLMYAFYKGDDLEVVVGTILTDDTIGNSVNIVHGLGSYPEVGFLSTVPNTTAWNASAHAHIYNVDGYFTYNGTTIRQLSADNAREDSSARADTGGRMTSLAQARVLHPQALPGQSALQEVEVTTVDGTNVTLTSRAETGAQLVGYALLTWNTKVDFQLEEWSANFTGTPSSVSETFPGFEAELQILRTSNIHGTRGSAFSQQIGSPWGWGITDNDKAGGINSHNMNGWTDENAQDMVSGCRTDDDWLRMTNDTGGISFRDAVLDSMDATGFTFTPAATAANAKQCILLSLAAKGGTAQNPTPSVVPLAAPAVTLDLPRAQNPSATQVPLAAPAVTLDLPRVQNPTATQVPLAAPPVTVELGTEQNPSATQVPLAAPAVTLDLPRAQNPTPSVLPLAAPAVTLDLPREQNPSATQVPLAAPPVTVELGTAQNPSATQVPLAAPAVTLDLPRAQNPSPSVVPLAAPPVTVSLGSEQNPSATQIPLAAPAVILDLPREQNPTASQVPLAAPAVSLDLPTVQNPSPSQVLLAAPPVTVSLETEQNPSATQVPLAAPPVTVSLGSEQNPTATQVPLAAPAVTLDLPREQNPAPSALPLAAPPVTLELGTEQNPTPLQVPLFAPAVTIDLATEQNPTPSLVPLFAPAVTLDLPLGLNPTPAVLPLFAPPVLRFAGAPTVILTLDLEVVSVLTLDLEASGMVTSDLEVISELTLDLEA